MSGLASATIAVDGTEVTGMLSLAVPEGTTLLLDSGSVTGVVDCGGVDLSVADDILTLDGIVDSDGTTFQGTYEANLNDGTNSDFGRFTMTRTNDQPG